MLLAPSILSADFGYLVNQVKEVEEAGVEYLHVDVMDGLFVPNITFGAPVLKWLKGRTNLFIDVHMMVEHPERYIKDFADAGAHLLDVHYEACTHLDRVISEIKKAGMKAAVALNPATPVSVLEDILPELDMVLLMSVNPGFGGQSYIPYVTQKIKKLRRVIDERGLSTLIEVDGGVNKDTIKTVVDAGADVVVAGSAIFASKDGSGIGEAVQSLRSAIL